MIGDVWCRARPRCFSSTGEPGDRPLRHERQGARCLAAAAGRRQPAGGDPRGAPDGTIVGDTGKDSLHMFSDAGKYLRSLP
jgi:hypothetical protein